MNVLDVIGDPELRETLLAVRGRPRAASISEIADATGVHRNVARRRLERLVAAGLLTASFERPPGRSGPGAGRPAKVYSPTPDTTAIEFPARRYPELVGLLVDAVPKRRRSEIGVQFGRELASTAGVEPAHDARRGLEGLCRALRAVGFQAWRVWPKPCANTSGGAAGSPNRATASATPSPPRSVPVEPSSRVDSGMRWIGWVATIRMSMVGDFRAVNTPAHGLGRVR